MHLDLNGRGVAYEIAGEGPWLTLIHAAGDNLGYWAPQAPEFSRRFRVLTYDQRGFGESSLPAPDYEAPELVRDLGELLNALSVA